MKRILILGCILIGFGVEASSSSQPVGRVSSSYKLSSMDPTIAKDRKTYTVEQYQAFVEDFYKQNEIKRYLGKETPDIREKFSIPISEFYRIGTMLGFKECKVKGAKEGEGIPTVDLSWPNMSRVFEDRYQKGLGLAEESPQLARAKMLHTIIEATNKTETKITKDNYASQKIDVNNIINLCLNEEGGLFYFINFDEGNRKKFENLLRLMLETYTGFQRIMSLLAVSILNSTEKYAFVPKHNKIGVRINPTVCGMYCVMNGELNLRTSALEEKEHVVILHEITHVYHNMMGCDALTNCKDPAYHILNSKDADFVGLFFPMLAGKEMEYTVGKIEECIDRLTMEVMRRYNWEFVLGIFSYLVDHGFANIMFPSGCCKLKNVSDEDLKSMLAKAIYCRSTTLLDKERAKSMSIWGKCEEMLTIAGLTPITDGEHSYLVEDRQNEEIHRTRLQENLGDAKVKSHFRVHCGDNARFASFIADRVVEKTPYMKKEDVRISFGQESSRFSNVATDAEYDKKTSERMRKIVERNNFSPLHAAVLNGNIEDIRAAITEALSRNDKEILNRPDKFGDTPLHLAARLNNVEAIEALLNEGADINSISDLSRYTPLHVAIKFYNDKAMETLLNRGANIDILGNASNYTPLHFAIRYANANAIEVLANCHANPNTFDNDHISPLGNAIANTMIYIGKRTTDALRALLKSNKFTYDTINAFYHNPKVTNTDVRDLLRAKLQEFGGTPLHTAY